jgi:long-chain fatty acid transport protein
MRRLRLLGHCAGIVAGIALLPGAANADGWKIQLQGGRLLGSSYAGRSVLAEDASTVWFNPAGLSELARELTMTAGAPVITYQLDYDDAGSTSLLGQPLLGPATVDGGTTAAVPHVYLAKGVAERWWVGFGFNAPYGLGTDYGEQWVGRYHATETRLTVFNLNPAVAVRLTDELSAGFGLDVQRSTATLANMIDFGSIGAAVGLPLTPQASDGRVEFRGDDWAAGWNAGLLYTPGDRSRVGASFRSRIDHDLTGTADFDLPPEASLLSQGGTLFIDSEALVVLPMPSELSLSASHRLSDRVTLLGDVTWTDWSVFDKLRVDFENPAQPTIEQAATWDDSLRVAVGARAMFGSRWSLMTGAAYETVPVPDATRTPRLPERDHTWLSAAGRYRASERWTFDFHVSHLITPDARIRLADPAAGVLAGSVHWRLSVIGVGAVVRF